MAFMKWIRDDRWHVYDLLLVLPTITTVCLRIGMDKTYIVAKTFYSTLCEQYIYTLPYFLSWHFL